jgi:hypothetical protein
VVPGLGLTPKAALHVIHFKQLSVLSGVDFLPLYFLVEGRAIVVLAQGRPNHLVAFQALDFPTFAMFVLALVFPARGRQRAVNKVYLEFTRCYGFPFTSVILAVEILSAIIEELQTAIGIVVSIAT